MGSLLHIPLHITPLPAMSASTADVLLVLIAILFPPASAAILTGCSCALFVNVLLTLLGYIPGHLHAFWLIYKKIQADERYGPQGSVYVAQGVYQPIGAPLPEHHHHHPQYHHQQQQHPGPDSKGAPPPYGAV